MYKISISNQIYKLNPWFYKVNIAGHMTTPGVYPLRERIFNKKHLVDTEYLLNRQKCRATFLIDEIIDRYDFTDKSILDLGCNCCYWSSQYLARGASSLIGIDGRILFLKQANLLLTSLGLNNKTRLIHSNVEGTDYTVLPFSPYDFVLCAGILYHTMDYPRLLKKISEINPDCLVIDTRVSLHDLWEVEQKDQYFNSIEESRQQLVPSKENLLHTLRNLGYSTEVIPPKFKTIKGVNGKDNYHIGNRIFLFCRKVTP